MLFFIRNLTIIRYISLCKSLVFIYFWLFVTIVGYQYDYYKIFLIDYSYI